MWLTLYILFITPLIIKSNEHHTAFEKVTVYLRGTFVCESNDLFISQIELYRKNFFGFESLIKSLYVFPNQSFYFADKDGSQYTTYYIMLYDRCGIPSTCKEICEFATKINLVDSLLRPSSNKSERHYSLGYRKYFKLHDMSTLETQSIMKCKRKNDIEDYEVGRYDRMNSRYKEFSIEIDGEKRSCKHED